MINTTEPSQSNASTPPDADSSETTSPTDASAGASTPPDADSYEYGRPNGLSYDDCRWEVECEDGWKLWVPLSNSGQPKEFDATPGSEVFRTSKNGKQKYRTQFLSLVRGIQTNVKTGTQRRLRAVS